MREKPVASTLSAAARADAQYAMQAADRPLRGSQGPCWRANGEIIVDAEYHIANRSARC